MGLFASDILGPVDWNSAAVARVALVENLCAYSCYASPSEERGVVIGFPESNGMQ